MKSLTVFCSSGLCNRLEVMVSGLAVAEWTGRRFRMLWQKTSACPAHFSELFADDFLVGDFSGPDFPGPDSARSYYDAEHNTSLDLLAEWDDDLRIKGVRWLLNPAMREGDRAAFARALEILDALKPVDSIQREIDRFRSVSFRSRMIGVHLRRGDFHYYSPESSNNTRNAMDEVDRMLKLHPESGIFLCTDDGDASSDGKRLTRYEGVREKFRRRYGDRVVWTSPPRTDPGFVRDAQWALIDLRLLRMTDSFVGTPNSSFSEVAHIGRNVEVVLVDGAKISWRVIDVLSRATGLYWILRWYGRRRYGRDIRFSRLMASTIRGVSNIWGRFR